MTQTLLDFQKKDDIIIVKFFKSDRNAADAYMATILPEIKTHISGENADKPMLIVLDISDSGMFSLQYITQQMQVALAPLPRTPTIYIAYLSSDMQDKVLVDMMNSLNARKVAHTRRIFPTDKLDEAIDWLKKSASEM